MNKVKSFGERIADALIEDKLLTTAQVEELLVQQKKEGTRLLKLLIGKAYVSDTDMAVAMGRVLNVPPINVARISVAIEVVGLIPKEMAMNFKVVPVARVGNQLFLAMADPLNVLALDDVKRASKLEVVPMISSEKAIVDKINNMDAARSGSMEDIIKLQEELDADEATLLEDVPESVDDEELASAGEDAPVIKLANVMLLQAIRDGASDIHLEPYEHYIRLRYRIDGALTEVTPPPKSLQLALASRLKIMSNLDISERRLPQDGRMRMRVAGREIDLRVSFLPTANGEKCVMRILDKSNLNADLRNLGMGEETFARFQVAIDSPHGLMLVTGPTGSGKTTTLYSVLNELNKPTVNIITVEDPIEFQIAGINQVPVRKEIGLTFGAALRSILRQDPDIIMIGEIRDGETAEIAVESALTGHQVLSTMHCNDAAGAITRLDDMGIAPFLISSSVILACAQRLMCRVCSACKEPYVPQPEVFKQMGVKPEDFNGAQMVKGIGCDRCRNTGYAGRCAIIEAMTMSDEIRKLVIEQAPASEINKVAIAQKMQTLREVAITKVYDGVSTFEQVTSVTAAH